MIRKLIYTTNTVEEHHRQIRKVTKNKGVFPNDTTLEKLVYLVYRNIRKKWAMPLANWAVISQQLAIKISVDANLRSSTDEFLGIKTIHDTVYLTQLYPNIV